MYSHEERIKAVKLYIQYDLHVSSTIRQLGYPSKNMLIAWYREYCKNGHLNEKYKRKDPYSAEQKKAVLDYYLEHDCNVSQTLRAMGYPARATLKWWIDELIPGKQKISIKRRKSMIQLPQEQKMEAVIELCTRENSVEAVAGAFGVSRDSLYKWKKELLSEEYKNKVDKSGKQPLLSNDKDALLAEAESLKKQIYRQRMELDMLKVAAEIIKKDRGVDLRELANKEKVKMIDALRMTYPLNDLLAMARIPKSSYFYQKKALARPDKYADIRTEVIVVFDESKRRYGYRRVHAVIRSDGREISEKVIRRIMKEEKLIAFGRKKRRYNSYLGETSPATPNVIDRDFHASAPNIKWLTDLTEFHIPAGKVYLSPIIDCFDGLAVSWTIGTSPDAELVNTMLDDAISCLLEGEHPIVHSDRGAHYRWPGWISRMDGSGLVRSMSKKGCSPDNSACEGFFGRLKNEMFYGRSWKDVSIDDFVDELDRYLRWYNEKRIKISLGALSPVDYRRSIGLVV